MHVSNKAMLPTIQAIVNQLKTINLYRVILFGSYAYGQPDNESDIDLIVVTNDGFFHKNYKEKSDMYLRVSNTLSDLAQSIPIDLIVYTRPIYEKFKELGSLFSEEILQHGVVLYENDHEGMAG